jgi:hypothetical protein
MDALGAEGKERATLYGSMEEFKIVVLVGGVNVGETVRNYGNYSDNWRPRWGEALRDAWCQDVETEFSVNVTAKHEALVKVLSRVFPQSVDKAKAR